MCMCGKPTINGEFGYCWNNPEHRGVRPVDPPDLKDEDELIYDEPGRCGGLDCHSHHFRLVKAGRGYVVVVRHGGGDERIDLGVVGRLAIPGMESLDSNGRYWLLHTFYSVAKDEERATGQKVAAYWRKAAAEHRIKVRKVRGQNLVKVSVEPEPKISEAA